LSVVLAVLGLVWAIAGASVARAQEVDAPAPPPVVSDAPRVPRVEITAFGGIFGGAALGETAATVLTNQVPMSGQTPLFTTRTDITSAVMVEGRFGMRVTGPVWVEAGVSHAQPDFAVAISGDVEGASGVTASSRLTQIVADAGLQYRWSGRRVAPFVMGGGGYLRQLDESRTTVENGSMLYGGGGVVVRLAPASRGLLGRLALRADVRAVWMRGGITLEDERGPALVAAGGMSIGL
jgi:hypothetical protein